MKSPMGNRARLIHRIWHFPALAIFGVLASVVVTITYGRAESIYPPVIQASPCATSPNNSSDSLGALSSIAEIELDDIRGGFNIAGLEMDFGANVRTFINGALALETVITATDAGITSQSVTPSDGSVTGVPGLTLVFGDGSGPTIGDVSPPNVDLSALERASGAVLNDSNGFTAALHQINTDQILGVLVNTAAGRTIGTQLDVNITVSNFRQFQQSVRNAKIAHRLAGATNR